MKDRADGEVQAIELKVNPGSKTTGIALVGHFKQRGLPFCSARTGPIADRRSRTAWNPAVCCGGDGAGARPAIGKPGSSIEFAKKTLLGLNSWKKI